MNGDKVVLKTLKERKYDFVFNLLVQEMRTMDIVKLFSEEFGDTERNCKNYIKKVREDWSNDDKLIEDRKKIINKSIAQYDFLYGKLCSQGKYKEAADVLNKRDSILGLNRITIDQNINSNQPQIDLSQLPLEMLLKMQSYLDAPIINVEYTESTGDENSSDDVSDEEESDPEEVE
ncbi:hypothetical protein FVR03_16790 [Pontibacter qinzhouensis]|uniref:Uncharacterized protein n=1 Tax=Pontibacter qinzhouensis TaxID=2603253 RepID=A0A5C8JGD7_9BACT|nr:hypothetical protein [Pontibacter qinzhouensis]TXK36799.1 hypothetical protein FVR03_16790 [Pontibacter qinzhouensis]